MQARGGTGPAAGEAPTRRCCVTMLNRQINKYWDRTASSTALWNMSQAHVVLCSDTTTWLLCAYGEVRKFSDALLEGAFMQGIMQSHPSSSNGIRGKARPITTDSVKLSDICRVPDQSQSWWPSMRVRLRREANFMQCLRPRIRHRVQDMRPRRLV